MSGWRGAPRCGDKLEGRTFGCGDERGGADPPAALPMSPCGRTPSPLPLRREQQKPRRCLSSPDEINIFWKCKNS